MTNTFCDGYCAYKLPCGYCERTGKRCYLESSVTWGVGTSGTPYVSEGGSTSSADQGNRTITEAWNGAMSSETHPYNK